MLRRIFGKGAMIIMKLVTVAEMRAIEQQADANGLTYQMMMANAGKGLAREIISIAHSHDDEQLQVLGLVGPGNNGGDTLIALTHLAERNRKVRAYSVRRQLDDDPLSKGLLGAGGELIDATKDPRHEQLAAFASVADVIVDGLLGTGTKLPLKDDISAILRAVQQTINEADWPPIIVACDCPSGVDCETGEAAEETLRADMTVTMAAVKQGLLKLPAYSLIGELRVVSIGDLDGLSGWESIVDLVAGDDLVRGSLPERPADSNKGTFGTALCVCGAVNYTGAALLAGEAAYRSGVGLVTVAVPAPVHMAIAGELPEATWMLLPHELGVISSSAADVLLKNLERVTALLIGPGLGLEPTTGEFIETLVRGKPIVRKGHSRIGFVQTSTQERRVDEIELPPFVIDADGLKLLAGIAGWPKLLPPQSILTPHPGEMAFLTGLTVDDIQNDRLNLARRFAQEWGHIVLLKGAFTVIAHPDGRTTTIPVATSALASAGTGDVLAGLVVGLRAQGMGPYDAAVAGAWVHARAGLLAADVLASNRSVIAGDILDAIPEVFAGLE